MKVPSHGHYFDAIIIMLVMMMVIAVVVMVRVVMVMVLVMMMVLMMRKTTMMHKVYDLMREGEWKAVCKEFQGEDEYRETLLLWVRPSQVKEVSLEPRHQSSAA